MKVSIQASLLILLSLASASYANEFDTAGSWQMNRLFHPNQADLVSEKKGKIIIYDGLTDKTVDRALDEHFDRIGALMFTRTIVTDDTGKPLQDPETGELVTEEDGCD
jgi:hypothetical protein